MNQLIKAASSGPQTLPRPTAAAVSFFHSTPVLEKRRKTNWKPGSSGSKRNKQYDAYAKRMRRWETNEQLRRHIFGYAEQLFQGWRDDDTSRFGSQCWSRGAKRSGFNFYEPQRGTGRKKGNFSSSDDDDDDDDERGHGWSYNSENFHGANSSGQAKQRTSWKWRYETASKSDLSSDRLALGLSACGPLKLEEVKYAYRNCALRWHPDRHQGPSKVAAEEKFKRCSAAYESLCEKLATH